VSVTTKALIGYSQQSRVAYEQAGTVATQAIENMRTVTSLAKERRFFELYERALQTPFMVGVKRYGASSQYESRSIVGNRSLCHSELSLLAWDLESPCSSFSSLTESRSTSELIE